MNNFEDIAEAEVGYRCKDEIDIDNLSASAHFDMSIEESLKHLFFENKEFSELIKGESDGGNKFRVYRSRYNKGKLGLITSIKLLIRFGYKITIEPPQEEERNK